MYVYYVEMHLITNCKKLMVLQNILTIQCTVTKIHILTHKVGCQFTPIYVMQLQLYSDNITKCLHLWIWILFMHARHMLWSYSCQLYNYNYKRLKMSFLVQWNTSNLEWSINFDSLTVLHIYMHTYRGKPHLYTAKIYYLMPCINYVSY